MQVDSLSPPLVISCPYVDFIGGGDKRCPDAVVDIVLSHLSFTTLLGICRVSRRWSKFVRRPSLLRRSVYNTVAFGEKQWTRCFNKGLSEEAQRKYKYNPAEFDSLPTNIVAILRSPCPVFPGKRVIHTHMLVRLPAGLTLNSLGELAKGFFPNNENGYRYIDDELAKEYGDRSIDKSVWLLMMTDILPGSQSKSFAAQKTMVTELARVSQSSYEVPTTLKAAASIFAQYFRSSLISSDSRTYTRLFERTYTRTCEMNHAGVQLVVGGFDLSGLLVYDFDYDLDEIGIAPLMKFSGGLYVDFIGGGVKGCPDAVVYKILSHLSITTLLEMRKVSKRWNELVRTHPLLHSSLSITHE